ncbi:MAG: PepSY domain-containing protein [Oscillospiraceae bacterium]|jgi:uncharacterized membrane protein YkoI|nr:PepSY domain-containing protein [Oscillospiraceae bacterium]
MNHHFYISSDEACKIALQEAGEVSATFHVQELHFEKGHGLYELDYTTDYMEYCCYVNAETGDVVGFDYQPRVA